MRSASKTRRLAGGNRALLGALMVVGLAGSLFLASCGSSSARRTRARTPAPRPTAKSQKNAGLADSIFDVAEGRDDVIRRDGKASADADAPERVDDPAFQTSEGWLDALPDWRVIGLTESPIKGPEGNIEFLIAAERHS